jgi:hypothetical protein
MLQLVQGGRHLDIATLQEFSGLLEQRERARARGVKWVEFAVPLNAGPANVLTQGPTEGFSWSVRVVSSTLGSAGTLTAYKASAASQTSRLVGYNGTSQVPQVMQYPSDTCMLQHGSALYLVASTTLTNYYLGAWEAIAEQAWKLAD